MDCFASLAMTVDTVSPSRDALRPRFAEIPFPPTRGRREDRVRAAPAVSCAMCTKKCAHEHTGPAESIRPSLRDGFTAYSALSPVTGFLATVAAQILLRDLTPASGRQDHTILPYVPATLVSRDLCVHRISPHVRDDLEPPLI